MDLKRLQEPFSPRDVEFRCQTLTKGGDKGLALAYIDSRAVQERLDEVAGPANWQCRYAFSPDAKKTLCEIGILVERNTGVEWVWKADGAGDSDVEPEKGALSDAFKRAGVKWGIGRYLYDLPALWVPCESRDWNGKKQWVKWTADPRASLSEAQGRTQQAESRGDQRAAQQPQANYASPGNSEREDLIMQVHTLFRELHPDTKFYPWSAGVLKRHVAGISDLEFADLRALHRHLSTEAALLEGQSRQQGKLVQEQGA